MIGVDMAQEARQGSFVFRLLPKVVDSDTGEFGYEAFESGHGA